MVPALEIVAHLSKNIGPHQDAQASRRILIDGGRLECRPWSESDSLPESARALERGLPEQQTGAGILFCMLPFRY
jgi:hypothetical protein